MPIRARVMRFTTWRSLATAATAALMATLLTPARRTAAPRGRANPSTRTTTRSASPSGWTPDSTATATGGPTASPSTSSGRANPPQQGRKIPVIMDASPYYSCCGRGNESQKKTYDANGNVVQMPLFYDNYFVPRGYAFVARRPRRHQPLRRLRGRRRPLRHPVRARPSSTG